MVAGVLPEDPVCPACLGRLVADRSFGLTNGERGRSLRTVSALVADEPFELPDPNACWVCEGHSSMVDAWTDRVIEGLTGIGFQTYQIGCRIPPLFEENDRLLREQLGLDPSVGEPLKRELNREVGKRVGARTGTMVDFDRPDVLVLLDLERSSVEVTINAAFVYGRYEKRERGIPQTKWPCSGCGGEGRELGPDGERPCSECGGSGFRYDRSVEQLTVPHVVKAMNGSAGSFHGAGREDVDARMIGTGRPFVIEVKDPKERCPDTSRLEREINAAADGAVVVHDLVLGSYQLVERVKELPANKTYRATVAFAEPVTETALEDALAQLDGATIEQRTPNRVDHRRADLVRTRTVHAISGELDDAEKATIELTGEGGLYVKELMHGDEGRTSPSLAGLLDVETDVTALDVLGVTASEEPFAPEELIFSRA